MRKTILLPVLIVGLMATRAYAQTSLPVYDVDANCAHSSPGPYRNECYHQEQEAYDQLKYLWRRFNIDDQFAAMKVAEAPGVYFQYTILLQYVVAMDTGRRGRERLLSHEPFHR